MSELQEDLQLLVDSLRYKNDDVEQQRQALQTIAAMCSENANANEYFCEHGGMDLIVEMMKTDNTMDSVRQAALYCISAVIEENVGAQMKLCNEVIFQYIYQLLECERSTNGMKATAVYLVNCLIHNNGSGQNICRDSKVLLKLIGMFKQFIDPMVSTEGASARNSDGITGTETVAVSPATVDGLELWISVCNTLGSACNNPQNEINQQRCAHLFAGAVSLLRLPEQHRMIRPVVSLLNYCTSGHYMNKERIRLVGGLRAIITLLKELSSASSCDATQLEQAVHLVRLLTTCVTDNDVNQKVSAQLDVIPVLLQLLKSDLLDICQKLCIVMCLAVLTDGNGHNQQQLADKGGFGLLIHLMATSKNDELCRAVTYVLHSCLKDKAVKADSLDEDIERLDAMLDNSYELSRLGHADKDEQTACVSHQFIDEKVSVEDKHCHVQQWLDEISMDNPGTREPSVRDAKLDQQTLAASYLAPLFQLLFTKGSLNEIKSHLPVCLQTEFDQFCQKSSVMQADTCAGDCTALEVKQDFKKEDGSNNDHAGTAKPTNEYQKCEVITAEEEMLSDALGLHNSENKQRQQESNLNGNESLLMDDSTNIMLQNSKPADKHETIKESSLLQSGIKSPLVPKAYWMLPVEGNQGEKNYTKLNLVEDSGELNPVLLEEAINVAQVPNLVPNLVPVSSRSICHATPCLHQGPKRLFSPVMQCLGCASHQNRVILTSRNYLSSLNIDKNTCSHHRKLVDKYFNLDISQSHHDVEPLSQPVKVDTMTDCVQPQSQELSGCSNESKADDANHSCCINVSKAKSKSHKSNSVQSQLEVPVANVLSPIIECVEVVDSVDSNSVLSEGAVGAAQQGPSIKVLKDATNAVPDALNVFDYHTPIKQDPRPTQLVIAKAFKTNPSRVKFTPNEEKYILTGVQKLGRRWRHILNAYPFHPSRTQVNIKDKYRQLCMK